MKKLFVVMLLIAACLSVTACSKEESVDTAATEAETEVTATVDEATAEEPQERQQSEAFMSHEEKLASGYYSNFEI